MEVVGAVFLIFGAIAVLCSSGFALYNLLKMVTGMVSFEDGFNTHLDAFASVVSGAVISLIGGVILLLLQYLRQ